MVDRVDREIRAVGGRRKKDEDKHQSGNTEITWRISTSHGIAEGACETGVGRELWVRVVQASPLTPPAPPMPFLLRKTNGTLKVENENFSLI